MYVSLCVTITLFIYGFIRLREEKREHMQKRMAVFLTEREAISSPTSSKKEPTPSIYSRFIKPVVMELKRMYGKRRRDVKEDRIEKWLQQAGYPFSMNVVDFRLLHTGLFLVLPLLSFGYAKLLQANLATSVLFTLIGAILASALPKVYLKQKAKTRNHQALRELPDVLDLLTVSLEAGLGFDAAISRVVAKKDGVLSSEFLRCLEEMRLGKTRREALSGIRERVEVDEVKSFISSILQAEKLGIGMVQVLRVQSNEVRDKRKQRAEEAAMKAPIKMLFPLVLFIFPSLFIVLLGPAIIQFLEAF